MEEGEAAVRVLSMVVLGLLMVVAVIVVGLRLPEVIGREEAEKEGGHTSGVTSSGRRMRTRRRRRRRTGRAWHGCRPTARRRGI